VYRGILETRSNKLTELLKFLLDSNGISYAVENEHTVSFNPMRHIRIKVKDGELSKARVLIEDLPRRFEEVEMA
jgi:hypothetical protein